jgi:hypothetical protein
MVTYERAEYFNQTLASLTACGEDLSNFAIFDDGSTSIEKLRTLFKVKNHFIAFCMDNVGPFAHTIRALNSAFNASDDEYVIYIQDDVLFSKNCFTKAIAIAKSIDNLGILSLYYRGPKEYTAPYVVMHVGHPGAVCWVVSRAFWKSYQDGPYATPSLFLKPNDERNTHFVRNLVDYKICRAAQLAGFAVAHVSRSLVQHIGDKSTLSENDMSFCRTSNFVGVEHGKE